MSQANLASVTKELERLRAPVDECGKCQVTMQNFASVSDIANLKDKMEGEMSHIIFCKIMSREVIDSFKVSGRVEMAVQCRTYVFEDVINKGPPPATIKNVEVLVNSFNDVGYDVNLLIDKELAKIHQILRYHRAGAGHREDLQILAGSGQEGMP